MRCSTIRISRVQLLGAIDAVAAEMPVIFPVHPRTRQRLSQSGIQHHPSCGSFRQSGPRIFFASWAKQSWSSAILVASRKKPQLLVSPPHAAREHGAPITIFQGTNLLVGTDPGKIVAARDTLAG